MKYWDLTTGDSCVLQPSNTSLRLLDDYEGGTVQNTLQSVVTSDSTIAALYSQGKTLGYEVVRHFYAPNILLWACTFVHLSLCVSVTKMKLHFQNFINRFVMTGMFFSPNYLPLWSYAPFKGSE